MRHHCSSLRILIAGSVAGLMLSCGQARAELILEARHESLYTQETIVHGANDPALAAYWRDRADALDFKDQLTAAPVVKTGHFTDANGRKLVVTTIEAPFLCNISGCPVRMQTERGEKLLDVMACNLAEDHHLSADGHTFIACDEQFPIPDPRQINASGTSASELNRSRPPENQLYTEQRDIKGPKDPLYFAYWRSEQDVWKDPSPAYRTIYAGHIVDANGRKLVVTTFHDPFECGINVCSLRIFIEGGDMILDTTACSAPEHHRISSNRRYLIACGQAFKIPESIFAMDETADRTAGLARTPRPAVEKLVYDSGSELEAPNAYVFEEYWKDKTPQIDWKEPAARRGTIHSSSLPSADGRALFLTMLESPPGGVCGLLCPARAFTAKHTKIMDVLVCRDRSQHSVSVDHRSFVACGAIFPIPQVDEITAIRENAPGDSDPDAYVEVVRRLRSKPANAPKPFFAEPGFHNRSQVIVSEWKDGTVEITYDVPRPGLPVAQGTLLFRGVRDGVRYSGTAYTFKAGCSPAGYPVTGTRDRKRELLVLTGAAPHRDSHSCDVLGHSVQSGHAKLIFDLKFSGDI